MEEQLQVLADASQSWLEVIGPAAWLQALIIAAGSLLLAWIAQGIFVAVIGRLARRGRAAVDDQDVQSLRRPLFVTIFFLGLATAMYRLELSETLTRAVLATLTTIGVLVWLGFAVRFARTALGTLSRLPGRFELIQPSTLPLFDQTAKIVLFIIALYFIFLAWNINVSALVASAGIAGLALSFAARDALSNIFGGISILADRPYKVGDYINLETGERGEVIHIGLRSTRLITRDDVEISIPNSIMNNAKIVNESGGPAEAFRIRVKVRVVYGSDLDRVEEVLMNVAQQHPEVLKTPEPRVRFRSFGESGPEFELLAWIERPVHRGRLEHELNRAVYHSFHESGIEIALPPRDVHLKRPPSEPDQSS